MRYNYNYLLYHKYHYYKPYIFHQHNFHSKESYQQSIADILSPSVLLTGSGSLILYSHLKYQNRHFLIGKFQSSFSSKLSFIHKSMQYTFDATFSHYSGLRLHTALSCLSENVPKFSVPVLSAFPYQSPSLPSFAGTCADVFSPCLFFCQAHEPGFPHR